MKMTLVGPMPKMPDYPTPWTVDSGRVRAANGALVCYPGYNDALASVIVDAVNEKFHKPTSAAEYLASYDECDVEDALPTYQSACELPDDVLAFRDANGDEAVRVADGWWWLGGFMDVTTYEDGTVMGHRAEEAEAPLTPIPWPDYVKRQPRVFHIQNTGELPSDVDRILTAAGDKAIRCRNGEFVYYETRVQARPAEDAKAELTGWTEVLPSENPVTEIID